MAGSYNHVKCGLWTLENIQDAHEAIEELFFLVEAHLGELMIGRAVDVFHQFETDQIDPEKAVTGELGPVLVRYGKAYLLTKEMMQAKPPKIPESGQDAHNGR